MKATSGNLAFWFHVTASAVFFVLYIFSYYKNFVKTNQNTLRAKTKLALILLVWSFFSFIGIILLFPKGSQNTLQEMCGMFWLAEIAAFFILIFFETAFLILGFVLTFIVKNLSYSNIPMSIINDQ